MNSGLSKFSASFFLICILPFCYQVKTRLAAGSAKISWIFTYFLPIALFFQYAIGFNSNNWLLLILGFVAINYVYENGYLENDIQTTKIEINPTNRLSADELKAARNAYSFIMLIRLVVVILLMWFLFNIDRDSGFVVLFMTASLQVIYLIYNRVRNILNLWLILPLNQIRIAGFIYPFIPHSHLLIFTLCSLPLYPVLKFLEFSTRERYGFKKIKSALGNIDTFRVKYYLIFCMLFAGGFLCWPGAYVFSALITLIYFFLYRLMCLVVVKRNALKIDLSQRGKPF